MSTRLPSLDICSLGRFHMMPKWGEAFFHEGRLYQKRACTQCGVEDWREVRVTVLKEDS